MSILFEKCELLNDFNNKEFKRNEVIENKEPNEKKMLKFYQIEKLKKFVKL